MLHWKQSKQKTHFCLENIPRYGTRATRRRHVTSRLSCAEIHGIDSVS